MKWNDFLNEDISRTKTGQVLTDIECPECGRHIYLNTSLILTSYPAKYAYWCPCGWEGYAHVKWTERNKND